MTSGITAQSKENTKPVALSDISSGYTYDFEKAFALIKDRIAEPNVSNEIVKPILQATDFPVKANNDQSKISFEDQIRQWMEKNPTLIINTLKTRQDIVTQY